MGSWTIAGNLLSINGAQGTFGTQDSNPLVIETSGNERLRVDASGNVGIGTSAPASTLDVRSASRIASLYSTTNGNQWVEVGNSVSHMNLGVGASGSTAGVPYLWSASNNLMIGNDGGPTLFIQGMGGGKVGVGTVTPAATLDVGGGLLHVGGTTTPTTTAQGAYLGWNALTGGTGETDFINNQGLGTGGFAFMNTPPSGSPRTTLMVITGGGNAGIGTSTPAERLQVEAGSLFLDGENNGVIVDAAGLERVGLMKYPGYEGMLIGDTVLAKPVRLGRWDGGTIKAPTQIHEDLVINSGGGVSIAQYLSIAGEVTVGASLTIGGAVYSTGNVGIGLSQQDIQNNNEPTSRLVVSGDVKIMGSDISGGGPGNLSVSGDITVTGDILLTGADCAEHFDGAGKLPEPGTVVVIDEDGALTESLDAYDKKVAGVVSGAGDYRHGIVLDQRPGSAGRVAVALVGKVYCKVDAQYSPIEVGDLLTTAPTPGHAMKATEPAKAFGAIIGKALRSLKQGHGLIPILVALQ
jgi:hypothetical protein